MRRKSPIASIIVILTVIIMNSISHAQDETAFVSPPVEMRKRCSKEDRLQRLTEAGGNEQCEEAVQKSLRWMKSTQAEDGSWGVGNKTAMTGLGLLAYLGHCETPLSEEFGESCLKAMTYLINHGMKNNGMLADNPATPSGCYEHAIAAYALAESTSFCKQLNICVPNLPEITQKAGQLIIDHQNENGGWAYKYEMGLIAHTDTSISGWQMQALHAMKFSGIKFKNLESSLLKGITFFYDKQNENGGFGYMSKDPVGVPTFHPLTGVGILCQQISGKPSSASIKRASEYIVKRFKLDWQTKDCDLYAHYFASNAMINVGGTNWEKYNAIMRDEVLKNQNPDGTWKDVVEGVSSGNTFKGAGQAQFYRTCLATLMLEVYYRYLPSALGNK